MKLVDFFKHIEVVLGLINNLVCLEIYKLIYNIM